MYSGMQSTEIEKSRIQSYSSFLSKKSLKAMADDSDNGFKNNRSGPHEFFV